VGEQIGGRTYTAIRHELVSIHVLIAPLAEA
jgi:hypothetical protein